MFQTSSSAIKDKSSNSAMKKSLEAPKNGIISTEKTVRKPLTVEYTNSPTIPNKTCAVSNQKRLSTDNSLVEKELSQSVRFFKIYIKILCYIVLFKDFPIFYL